MGCLETILGRRGLLRTVRRHLNADVRTWAQLANELAGQPVPKCLHATFTDAARVIATAINMAGVSKIVIVGDLPELGGGVMEYLTAGINAQALWGRFGAVRVEASPRQRPARVGSCRSRSRRSDPRPWLKSHSDSGPAISGNSHELDA